VNIYDLAATLGYFRDDTRVTPTGDGTFVVNNPDTGQVWGVALDEAVYWGAWDRAGVQVESGHDTPDEAIYALIGDPQ
jgi:hypothetical protein